MTRAPDYFLGRADRVAALLSECRTWRGTPFRERSAVKGPFGGVDCAGFLGTCFFNIGAVEQKIAIPPYALNHAQHSKESLFHAWFARPEVRARVRPLDEAEPHVDGDIVFPRVGACEHHAGFRIGELVHQIARPSGYCALTVAQWPLHRSRYRLMESLPV
jgi:hypothetical protein